jgi:AcrR family transcriptional regulator
MCPRTRTPLSRDRVLHAALELADTRGFEDLTMRKLAKELGVEAMSLYNHVRNKEDLLAGLVDIVFGEIEVAEPGTVDWRKAMRDRAMSMRAALNRHPWAIGLMEGRTNPGPQNIRYHNAVMGCLREGGFDFREAVHAMSALDAYTSGFALQERGLPFETPEESAEVIEAQRAQVPDMDQYPYLLEIAMELQQAGYDYATEFEFALDLILDGLEPLSSAG